MQMHVGCMRILLKKHTIYRVLNYNFPLQLIRWLIKNRDCLLKRRCISTRDYGIMTIFISLHDCHN